MMSWLRKSAVTGSMLAVLVLGFVLLSQLSNMNNIIGQKCRDITYTSEEKRNLHHTAIAAKCDCKPKIVYKQETPCECKPNVCKDPKPCNCKVCEDPKPCKCKEPNVANTGRNWNQTTKVDPTKQEVRYPDSMIIGEMKCGTSAMQFFLKFHPDVAMSDDEVDFFSVRFKWGWNWYKSKLPSATKSQIVMEKSVYFGSEVKEEAWRRIYEYKPDIKMILNLRDPVERTISQFNMKSKESKFYYDRKLENFIYERNNSSFINKTHYFINRGFYYTNMLRWIKYFPLRQILIVEADTFRKNPLNDLIKVEKHLGIRPFFNKDILFYDKEKAFYCLKHEGKLNCLPAWASNPKRPVSEKVMKDLKQLYLPETEKFYELIGRRFNWTL